MRTNCAPVTAYTDAVFGDQASCPTNGFAMPYGSIGSVQIGPAATSSRFQPRVDRVSLRRRARQLPAARRLDQQRRADEVETWRSGRPGGWLDVRTVSAGDSSTRLCVTPGSPCGQAPRSAARKRARGPDAPRRVSGSKARPPEPHGPPPAAPPSGPRASRHGSVGEIDCADSAEGQRDVAVGGARHVDLPAGQRQRAPIELFGERRQQAHRPARPLRPVGQARMRAHARTRRPRRACASSGRSCPSRRRRSRRAGGSRAPTAPRSGASARRRSRRTRPLRHRLGRDQVPSAASTGPSSGR